jgi:hypothetical protein
MPYEKHLLGLSKAQKRKLLHGHPVVITHKKLKHGDVEVELTVGQLKKLKKQIEKGKDYALEFKPAQIMHHRQHGAGFLDILKAGAKAGLKALAPTLANAAGNLASQGASSLVNYGVNKIAGSGIGPVHKMPDIKELSKTTHGRGILQSILTGLLSGAGRAHEHHDVHKLAKSKTGRGFLGDLFSSLIN